MLKYIICCCFVGLLLSCSESNHKDTQDTGLQELVVTDEMGRTLHVHQPIQRILPLCASSEETLVLLCDSSNIIGRTPECSSPTWIMSKPLVNNYPLDIEKVVTLKPDLIVSKEGMLSNDQLKKLESLGLSVYMQRADNIQGIAKSIQKLGVVIGQMEKASTMSSHFMAQFDSLQNTDHPNKLSAVGIISSDPIYAFGHSSYLTDVLNYCGLHNAIDSSIAQGFPVVDQEYLLKVDPDFLIFPGKQKESQELFVKFPLLKKLKAYSLQQCLYINGDWLSRPGPELIKAAIEINDQVYKKSHAKR